MSNLTDHARNELRIAGLLDSADPYNKAMADDAIELVELFSKQGHSGMSASIVTKIVEKLMRFEPLTPLNGDDDEWNEIDTGLFQNKRCSHVFKKNGEAYDINGRIFRDPDGITYTSSESRVSVLFPYVPKSEIVDRKP